MSTPQDRTVMRLLMKEGMKYLESVDPSTPEEVINDKLLEILKLDDLASTTEDKHELIPVEKSIGMFFHCKKCLEELQPGVAPGDYQHIEAGFTKRGIQVWCRRHDKNILHIDFQGEKHPAR